MKFTNTFFITYLLSIQFAPSQVFEVGDYINDLVGNICENGDIDWKLSLDKNNKVFFISSFATWWKPCQSEAQTIEEIYKQYKDKGVVGFDIAAEDLKLRGPGELLGKKQKGSINYRIANIVNDYILLPEVKKCCNLLTEKEIDLLSRRWQKEEVDISRA